ncbi:hypothetical protein [Inquilinus limosus]|uniref:Uncharacterized protein n=1 Tax=Inquilinus limosus MP06 TaxID=1398085 RepID=A0A0A0D023_9PROT|nr:hypothetical protein [Inquilinus limosus]KGM32096.1 hypothetical protein P409_23375 [Inquilinus limosus MP06]
MIIALILWAVIGPSVGMVVGAAFASRNLDGERPRAEAFGRSPDSALPPVPAGRLNPASP